MKNNKIIKFLYQINGGKFGKLSLEEIGEKTIKIYNGCAEEKISEMINEITNELSKDDFLVNEREELNTIHEVLTSILQERSNEL